MDRDTDGQQPSSSSICACMQRPYTWHAQVAAGVGMYRELRTRRRSADNGRTYRLRMFSFRLAPMRIYMIIQIIIILGTPIAETAAYFRWDSGRGHSTSTVAIKSPCGGGSQPTPPTVGVHTNSMSCSNLLHSSASVAHCRTHSKNE